MENTINEIILKPRFKIFLEQDNESVLKKLIEILQSKNCDYICKISNDHIFIDLPSNKQKIWSPQLELVIEKAQKGSVIRGLFAPKPSVWTLFIFLHFVTAISFFIFFALAYANYAAGNDNKFWVFFMGLMVFLWFFLYFLGQLGKRKAKKQMEELNDFLKISLKNFD